METEILRLISVLLFTVASPSSGFIISGSIAPRVPTKVETDLDADSEWGLEA
jgi:hypothetical protein